MNRDALVLISLVALAGCDEPITCGVFAWDEARMRCVCPPDTETLPNGSCALPDGSVIGRPDDDGGTGRDASPIDACEELTVYRDEDGDGFGDSSMSMTTCGAIPTGYVAMGNDCDDACGECHPDRAEQCDQVDNDCDRGVDEDTAGTACAWLCGAAGCDDPAEVAAGTRHACVRTSSGRVYCSGNNEFGQLGDGTIDTRTRFVAVTGLTDATDIGAGDDFTCAVRATGRVVCWGKNDAGQLGTGSTAMPSAPTPQPVSGVPSATEVECGGLHACARSGTSVACWGFNGAGQLGNGTLEDSGTAVTVTTLGAASDLALGLLHTCAVRTDGTVRCWGDGASGQLGNAATGGATRPTEVIGLSGVSAIAAGAVGAHTCARLSTGEVWCWGANGSGQLGDGSTMTPRTRAGRVSGLSGAIAIAAGSAHSCAADGARAVCWGEGDGVGDGTGFDRTTFVVASGVPSLAQLSAGSGYTVGVTADGRLYAWGRNDGQLADGTMTDRPTAISPMLPE
ncbi:MAG: hypothetical protein M3Y87_13400 [Myxococcota bacterium]|nr:hypothetical protein [Myxococcota bacterium]